MRSGIKTGSEELLARSVKYIKKTETAQSVKELSLFLCVYSC